MLLKAGHETSNLKLIARVVIETHVRDSEIPRQRVGSAVLKTDIKTRMTGLRKIGALRGVTGNSINARLNRYAELVRPEKEKRECVRGRDDVADIEQQFGRAGW